MEFVLNLGPRMHREAGPFENPGHAAQRSRNRVQAAQTLTPAGKADIDSVGGKLAAQAFGLKRLAARVDQLAEFLFGDIDLLAGRGPLLGWQPPEFA
jgi:hypothetical protein